MIEPDSIDDIRRWLGTGSINIFGYPFAGKDTLAHNLGKVLQAPVISGGDILRKHPDQTKIKQLMETGELFPTEFYLSVVLPYFEQAKLKDKPLVLSSVGRWSGEESTVLQVSQQTGHPIKAIIHLHVPEETVWQRFEASQTSNDRSHRHDDAAHILEVRLNEYTQKTMPVIEFYKSKGMLVEIDGQRQRKSTLNTALTHLHEFITAQQI